MPGQECGGGGREPCPSLSRRRSSSSPSSSAAAAGPRSPRYPPDLRNLQNLNTPKPESCPSSQVRALNHQIPKPRSTAACLCKEAFPRRLGDAPPPSSTCTLSTSPTGDGECPRGRAGSLSCCSRPRCLQTRSLSSPSPSAPEGEETLDPRNQNPNKRAVPNPAPFPSPCFLKDLKHLPAPSPPPSTGRGRKTRLQGVVGQGADFACINPKP